MAGFTKSVPSVVAFVEVRSSNDNRSAAIAHELAQLGASVEPTFSDAVTHVVYKEGLKRTWIRASKRGVPMVSVSWLESCKHHMKRMPESNFPAILPEEKSSPLPGINQISRWKKMRSMQPCDFDEEMARSAERGEKRRKRVMMANRFKLAEGITPTSSPIPILAMETQPRLLLPEVSSQVGSPVPDTPPSMKERLERMRREQMHEKLATDFASTETSSDEERESTSTMVSHLIHRLDSDDRNREGMCSESDSVEYLLGAFNKKLSSPRDFSKSNKNTSRTVKKSPTCIVQSRRCGLRVAPGNAHHKSLQTNCEENKTLSKELYNQNTSDCEQDSSDRGEKKSDAKKVGEISLAVSPKNINICIPEEKALQADLPPKPILFEKKLVGNKLGKNSIRGESENSTAKDIKRRRSCRVLSKSANEMTSTSLLPYSAHSKSKHTCQLDPNSNEALETNPHSLSSDLIRPKLLKKKRTLFTEPVLNSSLLKPAGENDNTSSEVITGKSDVAFLFGISDNSRPVPAHKTRNNKSVSLSKGKAERPPSKKSVFNTSSNDLVSNAILENSMSVMYGNDTTLTGEGRVSNSRRSIDEFSLSKKPFKGLKNGKSLKRVNLGQINESDGIAEDDGKAHHQTECDRREKLQAGNFKRSRSSSSSDEKAIFSSRKKQKCSTSESDERLSSPMQLNNTQPRLRHARSLVLEPAQVSFGHRVQYSLVVTSLHRQEQELVYSVLKKLGVLHLTNSVEASSTHVVCGEPRRTLNLLRAIAQGCWVLSKEWVFKSLEAGSWLREEEFEMDNELPVVKVIRKFLHLWIVV
ncbi:microcephalin-like [Plakobranchus ocellatus]|uniref:Microcephalin-like n=1 Tax=Plakobranchus ocellatus TaxID=259542 RepID=A0AAV4CY35_9GAST|nr:microcephalin-like [Plakobranchus ocellatus]